MNPTCIQMVVGRECNRCGGAVIKFGTVRGLQRFRCKGCNRTWRSEYVRNAYKPGMDYAIAVHVREGCGIRSIARLLKISPNTVMRRIRIIAASIQKPAIVMGRRYEVDELKTYVKNKRNECWVIYAIDKETKQVVDLKVGRRNQKNIKKVTDTLLLSGTGRICTDGLGIYRAVIPEDVHSVRPYGTNQIERMNLSLRTHLKRLNRRTICYTKRIFMLEACLAIYFWYSG